MPISKLEKNVCILSGLGKVNPCMMKSSIAHFVEQAEVVCMYIPLCMQ